MVWIIKCTKYAGTKAQLPLGKWIQIDLLEAGRGWETSRNGLDCAEAESAQVSASCAQCGLVRATHQQTLLLLLSVGTHSSGQILGRILLASSRPLPRHTSLPPPQAGQVWGPSLLLPLVKLFRLRNIGNFGRSSSQSKSPKSKSRQKSDHEMKHEMSASELKDEGNRYFTIHKYDEAIVSIHLE